MGPMDMLDAWSAKIEPLRHYNNYPSMVLDEGIDWYTDLMEPLNRPFLDPPVPEMRDAFFPRVRIAPGLYRSVHIDNVKTPADLIGDLALMDPDRAEKVFQQRRFLWGLAEYAVAEDPDEFPYIPAQKLPDPIGPTHRPVPSSGNRAGGQSSPADGPASSSDAEHSVSAGPSGEPTGTTSGSETLFNIGGRDVSRDQATLLAIPLVTALLGGLTAPGGKPLGGSLLGGAAGAALAALLNSNMNRKTT